MTASLSLLLPALAARWSTYLTARGLPPSVAADLVAQGDGKVPAQLTSPGQLRPLPLDARGGCVYVRRAGDVTLVRNLLQNRVRLTATVPLRLVVVADLEQLDCRDREVGLALGELLLAAVEAGGVPLAELGAAGAKVTPRKLTSDAGRIFTDELGFPAPLPARRGVAALDLEVELTLDPACLPACPPSDLPS